MSPGYLLAGAGIAFVVGIAAALKSPRVWTAATVAGAGAAFAAAVLVLLSGAAWVWQPGWALCGEPVFLRFDSLSALFVALLSFVSGAGAVYSREYWSDAEHPRSSSAGRIWWNVLTLSLGLILTVSNGVHFLIAWELFAISAYFLVTLDRHSPAVRAAGWLYLCASHVAALCLFAFFALMAARTGSWELGDMRGRTELCAALLAGTGRIWHQGGVVSAACLAAVGPCQRAEPRFGHAFRRDSQDRHLRTGPLQRVASFAGAGRVGGGGSRRGQRRFRGCVRAWST